MSYSLDFATRVSRICMDEILRRGLKERKILRKSEPNSVLLLKVFRYQNCTAEDLTHVSIHSVATLMQDTLWCCQERIVPKKVWRVINYETCTLEDLSRYITQRGENLLLEILDFLVQVMRYKDANQMDAYHLGEAMGKVTLGPADCDPIIAEKAGHFLTRMIIEHSKKIYNDKNNNLEAILSSMSKSEAARAKAKSYNRLIQKIHKRNDDWISIVHISLFAMMEDAYEPEPTNQYGEPYLSIFSKHLDPSQAITSPVLFRLVTEASKAIEPIPRDPFAESYLFNTKKRKTQTVENQIRIAFDDFMPLLQNTPAVHYGVFQAMNEKTSVPNSKHMKMTFSNIKLNLKKHKSQELQQGDLSNEAIYSKHYGEATTPPIPPLPPLSDTIAPTSTSTLETESYTSHSNKTLYSFEDFNAQNQKHQPKHHHVKKMMKKVIKIVPSKKTTPIY